MVKKGLVGVFCILATIRKADFLALNCLVFEWCRKNQTQFQVLDGHSINGIQILEVTCSVPYLNYFKRVISSSWLPANCTTKRVICDMNLAAALGFWPGLVSHFVWGCS